MTDATEETDLSTTFDAASDAASADIAAEDEDLEALKRQVQQMEEETAKLQEITKQQEQDLAKGPGGANKEEIDQRSVYVGCVDFSATPEELQAHFQSCGVVNRVTILCDKFTGQSKGFAYIEFVDTEAVENAVALNESLFKGRQLKVLAKRTNLPGMAPRGRFGRGYNRGRFGHYGPQYPPRRFYRGRGRGGYRPY
eukprot:TRINITY_DN68_c0_g1_i1.p2 TRINITY_DN68_c0_g1~~TRINITY_DN68_c0_g1_i1.p2  ORF type:complete len:197 (-),score=40.99 TRINITY_DN68_c0_g1_i1:1030-1620(-)